MKLVEEYQAATRPDYISWDPSRSSSTGLEPPTVNKQQMHYQM